MPPHDQAARTGKSAADPEPGNLALRLASAAVLVPLALATAYWSGWPFVLFWTLAALIVLWEWTGLVMGRRDLGPLLPGSIALIMAFALAALGRLTAAAVLLVIGTVIAAFLAENRRAWHAAGVLYAAAVFFGPVLLRGDAELGLLALLFLFAVVWATDIFAYFVGRAVGGPLLWPRVSPKKTWAGVLGGLAGAVAAGGAVAYAGRVGNLAAIAAIALLLSAVSQAGDLFESALKRHFAAKDASALIPGHGGLMDRLDGFLFAAMAGALIGATRLGMDAPARGLLVW